MIHVLPRPDDSVGEARPEERILGGERGLLEDGDRKRRDVHTATATKTAERRAVAEQFDSFIEIEDLFKESKK